MIFVRFPKSLGGILALSLALGGCSWVPGMDRLVGDEGVFRDRQGEYLEAESIPPTRVPDRYDSYVIDDLYVVPEGPRTDAEAFLDAPRPRPLEGRSEREVVIQRIDERSWVVVDASPSQVWPRIRDYWTSRGVTLALENPTRGVMETAWFDLEGNDLTKEKFRVTVEPGFQDESSEVKLLHMSMPQAVPAIEQVDWPARSDDQELAFDTLNDMASYLAGVADLYQASSVSLLAGNIPSEGKANLEDDRLRLAADYQRSWAAVGRALERAGVEVVSQDQAEGVYEVLFTVLPEEEEKGFFGRLFSLERFTREDPVEHAMRLRVQDNGNDVEVRAEEVGPSPGQSAEEEDPADALLDTIMTYIA